MQMRLAFILTFGLTINSWGQTQGKECICPSNQHTNAKPEAIFNFTNGNSIALCGYVEAKENETTYSDFVLAVCGQDKIIDSWDAQTFCLARIKRDTLVIEQLHYLPTGDNFSFQQTVWRIEKIYFSDGKVERGIELNRKIRRYSVQETKSVLEDYENAKGNLSDDKMILASKLFVAAISGDKAARKYLGDFKTRFGELDGAFAEDYEELVAMLNSWD